MAPESGDGTVAAPQAGATTPTEPTTTATSQPEGGDKTPKEATPPTPSPPPEKPRNYEAERKQERIDKLTAQKANLERELATAKAGQSADAAKIQTEIAEKAEKLANEKAAQIAAWSAFNTSLNEAVAEGQKEFGAEKFDKNVKALAGLNDPKDPETNRKYLDMLQATLDTGAAPKVLAALGEDPNEASRIMGLTPTKMGVELAKLAFRDVEDVSKAPKPVTPISGVGRNHVAIDPSDPQRSDGIQDTRLWMQRRQAQVDEVNKRAGRRIIP
jgi:hypothetical protein